MRFVYGELLKLVLFEALSLARRVATSFLNGGPTMVKIGILRRSNKIYSAVDKYFSNCRCRLAFVTLASVISWYMSSGSTKLELYRGSSDRQ